MSQARANFLKDISALESAVAFPGVSDTTRPATDEGVAVLRRGVAISALVMLEAFIRGRTEEVLSDLERWPARYEDLPESFRRRATIDALPLLEKYARQLRRDGDDFEGEVIAQAGRIAKMNPPAFMFTKFIAGDYVGNISESSVSGLLKAFQVVDCWNSFRIFAQNVGVGVPSVDQIFLDLVRNRHRSAHVSSHRLTASDMEELPDNVRLIAICFDAALSVSGCVAVNDWRKWSSSNFRWLQYVDIFFVDRAASKYRLIRSGSSRALRIFNSFDEVRSGLPRAKRARSQLILLRRTDQRPVAWNIVQ